MRRMAVIAVLLALLAGGAYAQSTPVRNGVLQTTLRAATNKIVELADPSTAANSMDAVNYRTLTNVVASGGSSFTGIVAGAYISGSGVAAIPVKATGLVDQVAFNTYTSAVPGSITNSMGLGAVLGVSPDALGRDATNFGLIRAEGTISCAQDIVAEGGMEAGSAISAGNSFDHGNNVGVTATALGFGGGVLTNSAPLTGMNTWLGSVGSSQEVVRTYVDVVSNMVVLASNNAASVAGLLATSNNAASIGYANAISNIYVNAHLWTGTVSICTTTGLQNFATATFNTLAWDSSASSYNGNIISNKWYRPPSAGKYLACYSIIATNFPIATSRKDIIHGLAVGGSSSFIDPVRDSSFPFAVAVTDFKYFNGSTILNLTTNDLVSVTIYNGGAPATSVWGPASTGYSGGRYFQIGRIE